MLVPLMRRVDLKARTHLGLWASQRAKRLRLRTLPPTAELIATVLVVTDGQDREIKIVRDGRHWYCDPFELNGVPMIYKLEPADATWTPLPLRFDLDPFASALTGEPRIADAADAELLRSRLSRFLTEDCVIWQGRLLRRLAGMPTVAIMQLPAPNLGAEPRWVLRLIQGDAIPDGASHFILNGFDQARDVLTAIEARQLGAVVEDRVLAVTIHRSAVARDSRTHPLLTAMESA